jgi:predicted Fe-Mo cluster-binding NifX family protein
MIVAIPVWQGRVSPVFDVAEQVLLVELDRSVEKSRREEPLSEEMPERRADHIALMRVNTLICGAISRPLESLLTARGVRVIPRVCGNVDEVLGAFNAEQLQDERFAMPGCCTGRRRRERRCGSRGRKNQQ